MLSSIQNSSKSLKMAQPRRPECERCVQLFAKVVDVYEDNAKPGLQNVSAVVNYVQNSSTSHTDCAPGASRVQALCAILRRSRRHLQRLRTPKTQELPGASSGLPESLRGSLPQEPLSKQPPTSLPIVSHVPASSSRSLPRDSQELLQQLRCQPSQQPPTGASPRAILQEPPR